MLATPKLTSDICRVMCLMHEDGPEDTRPLSSSDSSSSSFAATHPLDNGSVGKDSRPCSTLDGSLGCVNACCSPPPLSASCRTGACRSGRLAVRVAAWTCRDACMLAAQLRPEGDAWSALYTSAGRTAISGVDSRSPLEEALNEVSSPVGQSRTAEAACSAAPLGVPPRALSTEARNGSMWLGTAGP